MGPFNPTLSALALAFVYAVASQSQFEPTEYHLKIDASNLATSNNFSGSVLINMTVANDPNVLWLDAENLDVNATSLVVLKKRRSNGIWDKMDSPSLIIEPTRLKILFQSPLAKGNYALYLEYLGYYQRSMAGFAKVGYTFLNQQQYAGVTGMAPNHAPKVFPCLNDPGRRTEFTLELTVDKAHRAVSNVRPHLDPHNVTGTSRVYYFRNYPKMPVNQLAWAVLDQTYRMSEDNSTTTTIHTRAPYQYLNLTSWANHLTALLVQNVGNYTGLAFDQANSHRPSKIEQIILPEFFAGTSEGFGFTSFSEESILVDQDKDSARHKQDVALTLAKAVVQQWFGGIVSMDSWQNIWFLEGFSEYLQYEILESTREAESGWKLRDQAALELTQQALALDTGNRALAPKDGNETYFDDLTKYKGGALIRMLADVSGSTFKETVASFISESHKSEELIQPGKFWEILYDYALDKDVDLAKKSIKTIMDSWVELPGYPVVTVTSNSSHFIISQAAFAASSSDKTSETRTVISMLAKLITNDVGVNFRYLKRKQEEKPKYRIKLFSELNVAKISCCQTVLAGDRPQKTSHDCGELAGADSFKSGQSSNSSDWYVPVTYSLQGSSKIDKVWLLPEESSLAVPKSSAEWILLNLNQTGFYRVNYSSELRQVFLKQLSADSTEFSHLSRAQLIDDAFSLDPVAALELTEFLQTETDYFPWFTALRHYEALINSVAGYSSHGLLQAYILQQINGVIARVGYSGKHGESHIDKLLRSMVLEKACNFGEKECIQKAVSNLQSWMANTFYDEELSPALLCAGVGNSSTEVWQSVWSQYRSSINPSIRMALLKSLTCTLDKDLLHKFLSNITSTINPLVSVKDKEILLHTLSSKPFGAKVLFNWLISKLKAQANYSTTPVPLTNGTNTTTFTNNQTMNQSQSEELVPNTIPEIDSTENITDSDVTNMLNLIIPMLTLVEDGMELESVNKLGKATGLSNETLEMISNTTKIIYTQVHKTKKLDDKLTSWLKTEATSTSTGMSTKPTDETPQPSDPVQTFSSASRLTLTTTVSVSFNLVFLYNAMTL